MTVGTDGIDFPGVAGFAGGFGRKTLRAFGKKLMEAIVRHAPNESPRLESALRELDTGSSACVRSFAVADECTFRAGPTPIDAYAVQVPLAV